MVLLPFKYYYAALIRARPRRVRAVLRYVEADLFGGLPINNQFELGWGLHRQLGRLGTFENAVNIGGRTLKQIVDIDSIRDQPLPFHHETIWIDGRDTVARCESDDQLVMSHRENVGK